MNFRTMIAATALVSAASLASAVGTTWAYQGTLMDNGLPASGVYDVQVQLYDAANGGALLGTQIFNNANVTKGTFTAELDFGAAFDNGDNRWLAIGIRPGTSVGAYTILTPRQRVNPTPYAIYAQSANELRTRFSNGVLGNEAFVNSQAGEMLIRKSDGTVVVDFGPDSGTPSGGEIKLYDDLGGLNFAVDADIDSTGEPAFAFTGPSSGVYFYGGSSGTSSVQLPVSAVSASEMENEPGVAAAVNGGSVSITSTSATTILSRTINCPTAGYVIVFGQVQPDVIHVTGTNSWYNFGISDVSTSLPVSQDVSFLTGSALPSGEYSASIGVHGVFPVNAGNNTFYLLGSKISSGSPNCSAFEGALTCLFVPTAYGTVSSTILAPDDGTEYAGYRPNVPGLSQDDILHEQQQSMRDYRASVDAELKTMREQMKQLQQRLSDAESVREQHAD